MKDVILTGVRSNDEPTLGNYLGAFVPMVRLQKEKAGDYQLNMFVPDLHSFTTPVDHASLYERTLKNLKYFIAAGLDINNTDTYIYRQSFIPAHSELTWILDCFTKFGEMSRMTQFKEKAKQEQDELLERPSALIKALIDINTGGDNSTRNEFKQIIEERTASKELDKIASLMEDFGKINISKELIEIRKKFEKEQIKLLKEQIALYNKLNDATLGTHSSVGLFNYPVLMAADILLYGAKWVPVGDDQKQHLEITRDIATRMNNKFNDILTVPEDWNHQLEFASLDTGVRIRSLSNPEKKMSKSIDDPRGTILLSDTPDEAVKKIMSATTDNLGVINYDWENQPGITNLLQIFELLENNNNLSARQVWQGKTSYGELKAAVAGAVKVFLTDFQTRYAAVDEDALVSKLVASEDAMRTVANATLSTVQQAVGLRSKE